MSEHEVGTLLSYHFLTAPLNPNPVSRIEKLINKLRIRYRSYIVEFNVEEGAVMLPKTFGGDFGDQISRYAMLEDPKGNEFEVLVEGHIGCVYLTKCWQALRAWKRMVAARRIPEGMQIIIGAPGIGSNSTLYFTINRS